MGLSDDQKAMLRLLAQREQGYEDIAALLGLSVDEVRAKVGDALAQLRSGRQARRRRSRRRPPDSGRSRTAVRAAPAARARSAAARPSRR